MWQCTNLVALPSALLSDIQQDQANGRLDAFIVHLVSARFVLRKFGSPSYVFLLPPSILGLKNLNVVHCPCDLFDKCALRRFKRSLVEAVPGYSCLIGRHHKEYDSMSIESNFIFFTIC